MKEFLIWLFKQSIIPTIITILLGTWIKYKYDKKLEQLKKTIRENEEKTKGELRAKESEIDSLRNGVLSGVINRQGTLYERQVVAVEKLWSEILSLAPLKALSGYMGHINYDYAIKHINEGNNKAFIEKLGKLSQIEKLKKEKSKEQNKNTVDELRPFLSPLSYALLNAYRLVTLQAFSRYESLKTEMDMTQFIDEDNILKLIKTALPNEEKIIDKLGIDNLHYLLDKLEAEILVEIENILQGIEVDKKSIERAAEINKVIKELTKKS